MASGPQTEAGRALTGLVAVIDAVETEWYNGNMDEGARDRIRKAADPFLPTANDVLGILSRPAVDRSKACPLDPRCYRFQGHDGEHMHADPEP